MRCHYVTVFCIFKSLHYQTSENMFTAEEFDNNWGYTCICNVHISSLFTDYLRIQILSEVFTLSLISHYITGFNCNYRIHYNAEVSLNHCFMSTFSTIYVTDSVHISYFMRSHECTRVHLMFLDGQIVSKASGTIKFLAHQGLKRRTFQQAGSLSFQKSTKRAY